MHFKAPSFHNTHENLFKAATTTARRKRNNWYLMSDELSENIVQCPVITGKLSLQQVAIFT